MTVIEKPALDRRVGKTQKFDLRKSEKEEGSIENHPSSYSALSTMLILRGVPSSVPDLFIKRGRGGNEFGTRFPGGPSHPPALPRPLPRLPVVFSRRTRRSLLLPSSYRVDRGRRTEINKVTLPSHVPTVSLPPAGGRVDGGREEEGHRGSEEPGALTAIAGR